jgi:osmotically-inducible protein OsmY
MSVGLVVGLSLGLLAAPGFTAQGPSSGPVAAAEGTVKDAGTTATREVTDSWLTLKTKLALLADERISSNEVSVKTVKGVITLHGKVASAEEQKAAEEIALTIEGQKKVINQLTVVPAAERKMVDRQDDQLVTDVKQGLKKDASLKKTDIEVRAEKGIVTLTGKAPSLETSVRASEVARRVSGVRAVRNELAVPAHAAARDRAPAATTGARPAPAASNPRAATTASRVDRVEDRITMLHATLNITPAQEELWTNVTQVMRDNAKTMDALTTARADQAKTMTAVEDLKSYTEITKAHAEGLTTFLPAFEALYASMSDAQKAEANTMFRGHQRRPTAAKATTPKSPAMASNAASVK